jgi:hypothetical protein
MPVTATGKTGSHHHSPESPGARHIRPIPGTSRAGSSTALPPIVQAAKSPARPYVSGPLQADRPEAPCCQRRAASWTSPNHYAARGYLAELHPQPAHASLPRAAQNDHYGMVRHDIGGNPTADHNEGGYRTIRRCRTVTFCDETLAPDRHTGCPRPRSRSSRSVMASMTTSR